MCIFLLKQTVSFYVSKDTLAFSAFLDASKALDRTNHMLCAELTKCNVPMCIVRLLLSWYRQHTMQVNGVRQGGVLSPYLFAVYLDEVSIQLGSTRVGCTVGNTVVNHLCLLTIFVCSAPVVVGCNVFSTFVMTTPLNTKSLSIVTKQLLFFFAQKVKTSCMGRRS